MNQITLQGDNGFIGNPTKTENNIPAGTETKKKSSLFSNSFTTEPKKIDPPAQTEKMEEENHLEIIENRLSKDHDLSNSWNCNCGHLNMMENNKCESCEKMKPKFTMILPQNKLDSPSFKKNQINSSPKTSHASENLKNESLDEIKPKLVMILPERNIDSPSLLNTSSPKLSHVESDGKKPKFVMILPERSLSSPSLNHSSPSSSHLDGSSELKAEKINSPNNNLKKLSYSKNLSTTTLKNNHLNQVSTTISSDNSPILSSHLNHQFTSNDSPITHPNLNAIYTNVSNSPIPSHLNANLDSPIMMSNSDSNFTNLAQNLHFSEFLSFSTNTSDSSLSLSGNLDLEINSPKTPSNMEQISKSSNPIKNPIKITIPDRSNVNATNNTSNRVKITIDTSNRNNFASRFPVKQYTQPVVVKRNGEYNRSEKIMPRYKLNLPNQRNRQQNTYDSNQENESDNVIVIKINEWECNCGFFNLGKKANCTHCGKGKDAPLSKERKSDWTCVCGFLNFAKRNDCKSCKKMKPKFQLVLPSNKNDVLSDSHSVSTHNVSTVSKDVSDRKQGKKEMNDWNCLCGFANFAKRDTCKRCGKTFDYVAKNKPKRKKVPKKIDLSVQSGWKCKCGCLNLASVESCKKCGDDYVKDHNIYSLLK